MGQQEKSRSTRAEGEGRREEKRGRGERQIAARWPRNREREALVLADSSATDTPPTTAALSAHSAWQDRFAISRVLVALESIVQRREPLGNSSSGTSHFSDIRSRHAVM